MKKLKRWTVTLYFPNKRSAADFAVQAALAGTGSTSKVSLYSATAKAIAYKLDDK